MPCDTAWHVAQHGMHKNAQLHILLCAYSHGITSDGITSAGITLAQVHRITLAQVHRKLAKLLPPRHATPPNPTPRGCGLQPASPTSAP